MYNLASIGKMVRELYCAPKTYTYAGTLYVLDDIQEGALVEYWQPSALGGSAVDHDNPVSIFGPGLNAHPNSPDGSAVLPAPSFTTTNAGSVGFPTREETTGTDQIRMTTYACALTPFTLVDTNGNTGERGAVLLNGALTEDNTDSEGADRTAFPPIAAPAGVSSLVIATSDLSFWQGIAPNGGEGVTFFAQPPTWIATPLFKCSDLSGGFVDCDGLPVVPRDKDYWGNAPPNACPAAGGASEPRPMTLRIVP